MLEVNEIRGLFPAVVKYVRDDMILEDVFYIDLPNNEVRYGDSTNVVLDPSLRDAILGYIARRTPTVKIPPLPQKPDAKPSNFAGPTHSV